VESEGSLPHSQVPAPVPILSQLDPYITLNALHKGGSNNNNNNNNNNKLLNSNPMVRIPNYSQNKQRFFPCKTVTSRSHFIEKRKWRVTSTRRWRRKVWHKPTDGSDEPANSICRVQACFLCGMIINFSFQRHRETPFGVESSTKLYICDHVITQCIWQADHMYLTAHTCGTRVWIKSAYLVQTYGTCGKGKGKVRPTTGHTQAQR